MLVSVLLALTIGYISFTNKILTFLDFSNSHSVFLFFYRLIEYNTLLKSLKTRRDTLYSRLSELLESKVWF